MKAITYRPIVPAEVAVVRGALLKAPLSVVPPAMIEEYIL